MCVALSFWRSSAPSLLPSLDFDIRSRFDLSCSFLPSLTTGPPTLHYSEGATVRSRPLSSRTPVRIALVATSPRTISHLAAAPRASPFRLLLYCCAVLSISVYSKSASVRLDCFTAPSPLRNPSDITPRPVTSPYKRPHNTSTAPASYGSQPCILRPVKPLTSDDRHLPTPRPSPTHRPHGPLLQTRALLPVSLLQYLSSTLCHLSTAWTVLRPIPVETQDQIFES